MAVQPTTYVCDHCPIRQRAQQNPNTFLARAWRFHTNFCPMWNSYQAMQESNIDVAEAEAAAPHRRRPLRRWLPVLAMGAVWLWRRSKRDQAA